MPNGEGFPSDGVRWCVRCRGSDGRRLETERQWRQRGSGEVAEEQRRLVVEMMRRSSSSDDVERQRYE
ncbi:hypothetical protein RHGRI_010011 [Rhododendron griersonianum]|uniref:Uncharacterized protein n=1 Tax=Rhododendron griersonianum TaxID=479676 RepID=A0AAV6KGX8_9ERIC|nr:hypothetical protein RHGRI_010011 [Rhododendron griersonianum]